MKRSGVVSALIGEAAAPESAIGSPASVSMTSMALTRIGSPPNPGLTNHVAVHALILPIGTAHLCGRIPVLSSISFAGRKTPD
jgi:hypothetical protein